MTGRGRGGARGTTERLPQRRFVETELGPGELAWLVACNQRPNPIAGCWTPLRSTVAAVSVDAPRLAWTCYKIAAGRASCYAQVLLYRRT